MTDPEINQFILDNPSFVYGALKKLKIKRSHPDYEDLAQDGFLHLLKMLQRYQQGKKGLRRFKGFAFVKLQWFLRKQQMVYQKQHEPIELTVELTDPETEQLEEQLLFGQWLPEFTAHLSPREQQFTAALVLQEKSITQIAADFHISRQSIYKWKKRLQRVFRQSE